MTKIATVIAVAGEAHAFNPVTKIARLLKAGDAVERDEIVQTAAGGKVQLQLLDGDANGAGEILGLDEGQAIRLDEALVTSQGTQALAALESAVRPETIVQALERGGDLNAQLEPTAAGLSGGGGGQGNAGIVRLLRIAENVDPLSFDYETELLPGVPSFNGETVAATLPATEPPATEPPATEPPVNLNGPKNTGGDNGFGNGDQNAPGNSGPNNNAENAAPSEESQSPQDNNAGGNGNGNNGNNANGSTQQESVSPSSNDNSSQASEQNNGFGNGDQTAPGNSETSNNAENAAPSEESQSPQGNNAGGNGNGNNGNGKSGNGTEKSIDMGDLLDIDTPSNSQADLSGLLLDLNSKINHDV